MSNTGAEGAREIEVGMQDNFFEVDEIRIRAGETVRIVARNGGSAIHNMVVSTADVGEIFESDHMINPGEESAFEVSLQTPGIYPFFCAFHMPGMEGTVVVE